MQTILPGAISALERSFDELGGLASNVHPHHDAEF